MITILYSTGNGRTLSCAEFIKLNKVDQVSVWKYVPLVDFSA